MTTSNALFMAEAGAVLAPSAVVRVVVANPVSPLRIAPELVREELAVPDATGRLPKPSAHRRFKRSLPLTGSPVPPF